MKVTNWRRKLAASLVAGGLLAPAALPAANLDTNLVVDPSFEDVEEGTTCCYLDGATKLNSWSDGSVTPFAYNYALGFDDGGPLAGGGLYFFGAGGTDSTTSPPPITVPGEVSQNIDVSTGATATQIASGEAAVVLSGFFTAYNGQTPRGSLHVEFLNSGGGSLGSKVITSDPPTPWHEERGVAFVPVGTATLRASLYGDATNAYVDLVDVRVTNAVNELLFLEVNTSNGQVAIKNQSGEPFQIEYYKIESASNSLNPTAWNSLQEQNMPGFPAGNGSGNGWEQFGGSGAGVIGESFLTGNSTVANSAAVGLGPAFNASAAGDYNNNGAVDAADYAVWRDRVGTTNAMPNDPIGGTIGAAQYNQWRANFGRGGTRDLVFQYGTVPGELVRGFVRYVTTGSATAVPEPSSAFLVGIGLGSLAVVRRRKSRAS